MPQLSSEAGTRGENSSFLHLLFYSAPSGLGDAYPHWEGRLAESTDSNANLTERPS